MVRVDMASASEFDAFIGESVHDFFTDHLGPDILADAQRYVPVDTARLLRSLDFEVHDDAGPELIVGSFPDAEGDVKYAAATELGFHGPETVRAYTRNGHPVREHERQGNTPAQPYLRPALWTERYQ